MSSDYILTDKEKEVVKCLGLQGPKSGYDFHLGGKERNGRKPLMANSTWSEDILPRLRDDLKIICRVKTKADNLKGRPKDEYWLTGLGIVEAMRLLVKPSELRKTIKDSDFLTRRERENYDKTLAFFEALPNREAIVTVCNVEKAMLQRSTESKVPVGFIDYFPDAQPLAELLVKDEKTRKAIQLFMGPKLAEIMKQAALEIEHVRDSSN